MSNYRKSLYEDSEDIQDDKPIQLSSKLKHGKLGGYLNYMSPHDMLNSVQEQYIKLHEQDLDVSTFYTLLSYIIINILSFSVTFSG